jgi:hypothetical protein
MFLGAQGVNSRGRSLGSENDRGVKGPEIIDDTFQARVKMSVRILW